MVRNKGPRMQGRESLGKAQPEQRASRINVGLAELVKAQPALLLDGISVKVDIAHRLTFSSKHKVAPHLHPFFEFTYVEKGQMYYTVEERSFKVGPGQAFIMPTNNVHHWESRAQSVTLFGIMCTASPTRAAKNTLGHRLDEGTRALGNRLVASSSLRAAIRDLYREADQRQPDHQKAAALYLNLVLLNIFRPVREALGVRTEDAKMEAPLPARRLVLAAKAYAEANLPSGVSVQDLARHLEISTRHVNRVFRETEERSAVGYLQELRLERAKTLLREARYPVKAVAGMCGFKDLGYFSRCFRKETGRPPTAFVNT